MTLRRHLCCCKTPHASIFISPWTVYMTSWSLANHSSSIIWMKRTLIPRKNHWFAIIINYDAIIESGALHRLGRSFARMPFHLCWLIIFLSLVLLSPSLHSATMAFTRQQPVCLTQQKDSLRTETEIESIPSQLFPISCEDRHEESNGFAGLTPRHAVVGQGRASVARAQQMHQPLLCQQ